MRVLFFAPYTPNIVRVRPYSLLRALAAQGHVITLATVWETEAEREWLQNLRSLVDEVIAVRLGKRQIASNLLQALVTDAPLQSRYSWHPGLLDPLRNRLNEFDVVHVEHLRGVAYGLAVQRLAPDVPIVWDAVDCISCLFQQAMRQSRSRIGRWRSRIDLARTRRFERDVIERVDTILVTSPVDRNALSRMNPMHRPIYVLANGVDLEHFRPDPDAGYEPNTVVVSGKMSYHANVSMVMHLVERIMPLIWQARPQTRLQIVGKDPAREIRALSTQPQIEVTGFVPDMRPYLQRAAVAVSPIVYGAGIQNKVLEAMACGTPVVASPQAVGALSVEPGRQVAVAAEPRRFARQVLSILSDPERRNALGTAGRAYVMDNHSWANTAQRLEATYHEVIVNRRSDPARAFA